MLDLPLHGLGDDVPAVLVLGVDEGGHQAVALVEVGLPVQGVVFVRPRHVPYGGSGEGDGRHAGAPGAQAVLRVVPLDEEGQAQADPTDHGGRDQAHQPAVVIGIGTLMQPGRRTQRGVGQVVVRPRALGRAPPEAPRLDVLGVGVQHRALVHGEHVPAHDRGHAGQVGEGDGPHDALGLDAHVVVQQEDVVGAALQRLVHAAREAAGAAQVGLIDDAQALTQGLAGRREVRVVDDVLIALVGDDDLVEHARKSVGGAQLAEHDGAVGGAVEGGDADRRPALGGLGRDLRLPAGRLDDGVLGVGRDIEPVPAAVAEGVQRELEDHLGGLRADAGRIDAVRGAAGVGLVNDDGARAGHGDPQGHLLHDRPAPPVRRGECVEVGSEGRTALGRDPVAVARDDLPGALAHGLRHTDIGGIAVTRLLGDGGHRDDLALGIQREDVGVAVGGQDETLQDARCGAHASIPSPFSAAPSRKCGAILLSNIDRAEPMAMCMSRYL